jgi:hypothetical protein
MATIEDIAIPGATNVRRAEYGGKYTGKVTFTEYVLAPRYSLGLTQILGDMLRGNDGRRKDYDAMYRYARKGTEVYRGGKTKI